MTIAYQGSVGGTVAETLAIYPSARKVLRVLKDESRSRVLLGHSTMTIKELVERLWRDLDDRRAALSLSGERLALDTVMRDQRLDEQAGLESSPGLVESLVGTIRQLKSAAIEPKDLFRACDDSARNGFAAHEIDRITWVGRVFEAYEQLLADRTLADGHDRELAVVNDLHRAERADSRPRLLDGVTRLHVAEIYDLSLLQYMLIASLIRLLGDATITIQAAPHDANDATFPGLTWNRFVEDESIADQTLPAFVRRGGRDGRLNFILEHIFAPNLPTPPPYDSTVRIIEAPTRTREFEQVARFIRGVLERADGDRIAPDRIAIVARDMAPFGDELRAVMRRYRVPLNLANRPSLARSPVGRFVLALLRMPLGGFRRDALIRLLDSGFISHNARRFRSVVAGAGFIDESTKPLDECIESLCARLVDDLAALAPDSDRCAGLKNSLERAERSRAAFSSMFALLRPLAEPATVAAQVDRLRSTLARLGFAEATGVDGDDETLRHIAALNSVLDALSRDAGLVSPGRTVSSDEFADVVELALTEAPRDDYPAEPARAVQALSVDDARGLDFDLVFVVGLNDEVFPHYHNEDPVIADALKLKLNRALAAPLRKRLSPHAPPILGRILRTRYEYNRIDAFLFFLAVSMPARELVLTYSTADAAGAPLARSPFVDQVIAVVGGDENALAEKTLLKLAPEELNPSIDECFTVQEFLAHAVESEALASALAKSVAAPDELASIARRIDAERARAGYFALPSREERREITCDPVKAGLAGYFDGRVAGDWRLRQLLLGNSAAPRHWRAGFLDELAVCGFKFFAARILRLTEDEELDYEPSALEEGTLAHSLLADLLLAGLDFSNRHTALERADRFLESRYDLEKTKARDAAFFDIKWSNVRLLVRELVLWEVGHAADHEGRELTTEGEVSAVVRDHRAAAADVRVDVTVRGRYDRLEVYRNEGGVIDRIRVIDYKTSRALDTWRKAANTARGEFGVTRFQLPVYLLGVMDPRASELARDATIESGYLVLKSREKSAIFTVPRALIEGVGAPVPTRIIDLVVEALDGRFDVDPYECSNYCPFRTVCRYEKRTARE